MAKKSKKKEDEPNKVVAKCDHFFSFVLFLLAFLSHISLLLLV